MDFLFKKTDIASLIFFRIVFGVLATVESISLFSYLHLYKGALDPDKFHFKYYGFEWVEPMPEPFMSIFFIILTLLALCIIVGWRYRLATLLYAFGFSYTYFLDATFYLNHGYLFMVLCFVMFFYPVHRAYSLDVLQKRVTPIETTPYWPLFLLKFLMAVVYIYGGIAKLNPDWLNGVPLKIWLANKSHLFLIGPIVAKEWTAYFMSYGGVMLDLLVVFFLLNRKTRPWAFSFVLFFHFVNLLVFEIGIFPWMSTALTALYFSPDFPRRVWSWLSAKNSIFLRIQNWWQNLWAEDLNRVETLNYSAFQQKTISTILVILCSIQLLVPLRHHLYKGNVLWTEQGHRCSWRMMLRSKAGQGYFKVVDAQTKKSITVRPKQGLSKRQARKVYSHPYMILQYAHYLRDKYEAEGVVDPEVYAHLKLRVNGRPYADYVDKTRDLAKVEWSIFRSIDWLEDQPAKEEKEEK